MKFVAYKDYQQLDERTDLFQWKQLIKAFGYAGKDLQMISEWDDSMADRLPVVVFDQVGTCSLKEFVHPPQACYVFGRTHLNDLPALIKHDHSVAIITPRSLSVSMFGVSACAIALWDRQLKA